MISSALEKGMYKDNVLEIGRYKDNDTRRKGLIQHVHALFGFHVRTATVGQAREKC